MQPQYTRGQIQSGRSEQPIWWHTPARGNEWRCGRRSVNAQRCRLSLPGRGYSKRSSEFDVARASADVHLEVARHLLPRRRGSVPHTPILGGERERSDLRLGRFQHHLGEPSQSLWWLTCDLGEAQVELHDRDTLPTPNVSDGELDRGAAGVEVGPREIRVAQPSPKGVRGGQVHRVEEAVPYQKFLRVRRDVSGVARAGLLNTWVLTGGREPRAVFLGRERQREPPRWVGVTKQGGSKGSTGRLAGEKLNDDGLHLRGPRHEDGTRAPNHYDRVGIDRGDLRDEGVLSRAQRQIVAVIPFGRRDGNVHHHNVHHPCDRHRRRDIGVGHDRCAARLIALPHSAAGVVDLVVADGDAIAVRRVAARCLGRLGCHVGAAVPLRARGAGRGRRHGHCRRHGRDSRVRRPGYKPVDDPFRGGDDVGRPNRPRPAPLHVHGVADDTELVRGGWGERQDAPAVLEQHCARLGELEVEVVVGGAPDIGRGVAVVGAIKHAH
eukprot:m.410385 g.410385  ORF g.410385 m.410385 type:complete len:494 (+) comp28466_c1_seq2:385-1866(+)